MNELLHRIAELERRLHATQQQVRYWRGQIRSTRARRVCSGCGAAWDLYTTGCRQCTFRHSKRRAAVHA